MSAQPQDYAYDLKEHQLSKAIQQQITARNLADLKPTDDPMARLGGGLAFHCTADLKQRKVIETAAMATLYRGYEAMLPGRDLNKIGLVSATASGICGGVHATASALCLEMALGLKPPPLGIVLRNLLLSCQYLNDNTMHLFVLGGPDYSQRVIEQTNPEVWQKACRRAAKNSSVHGYRHIGDIMIDLNKPDGRLYTQALDMIRIARQAYTIIGGKYPHSESIVAGGVSIAADMTQINAYRLMLEPFSEYAARTAALWDDIFDFMLDANPLYEQLGRAEPSMLDFGQWDHEDYYDGSYLNCDQWGEKRWSTPGAIINGKLQSTKLSLLNAGMEEFVDCSYYQNWVDDNASHYAIKTDPLGNSLSPHHPWNKRLLPMNMQSDDANQLHNKYSWGTSQTWRRNTFEVGAYVRMYLSAMAQKIPASDHLHSTGKSLDLVLPGGCELSWKVPNVWNAFERNRARAYALSFNLAVTIENIERAEALLKSGENRTLVAMKNPSSGRSLGVGLWGAGRGFLAHWAVLDKGKIDNYQIAIPSRVNAAPRTPWGAMGACENAVFNTPIIESNFKNAADFSGIDIQRAIQSFDPCMRTTAYILMADSNKVLERVIDTSFPI